MGKKALIVQGGWTGHHPKELAEIFERVLRAEGFELDLADSLDALKTVDLTALDLVVPIWTMGSISGDQLGPLCDAVRGGIGIAGCHGGMCDSFREATEYQFMTGGQWVAHPGNDGVQYTVNLVDRDHFITRGIADYSVRSEQYYMHVDPSNHVLATTRFPSPGADGPHVANGAFDMPVAWTRYYGKGRVFYHSVGHTPEVVEQAETLEMCRRGFLWAARAVE